MRFARFYFLGALACLGIVFASGNLFIALIFGWSGLSLLAVSVAYVFNAGWIFRKRKTGVIPGYIRWLFFPFLFGARLYNEWQRRTDSVPPMQQIEPNLYLACRLFHSDADTIRSHGIKAVLDVTAEFDGLDWTSVEEGVDYLNIPVLDHQIPTPEQLTQAINWIHNHVVHDRPVIVHCALGRGRSVLVMCAYLLTQMQEGSIQATMRKIQAVRKTARLNKRQFRALNTMYQRGKVVLFDNVWLIANPAAGGGNWATAKEEILSYLQPQYHLTVKETGEESGGQVLAQQAVEAGAKLVVVCGGDGTVRDVTSALTGTAIPMGIIPIGAENALARGLLGIKSKAFPVSTACSILLEGQTKLIDTAVCNGKPMLLLAAIGFQQQMMESTKTGDRESLNQLAHLRGVWQTLSKNETFRAKLVIDGGEQLMIETQGLVVANAVSVTSFVAQDNSESVIDDGRLDLTWLVAENIANKQFVTMAELAFARAMNLSVKDKVAYQHARSVRIEAEGVQKYTIDGEEYSDLPLDIKILPASLNVVMQQKHDSQ